MLLLVRHSRKVLFQTSPNPVLGLATVGEAFGGSRCGNSDMWRASGAEAAEFLKV